jgi:type III secretion protein L
MDVVLPRLPLTDPLRPQRFGLRLAPGTQVVRRADWLVWRAAAQAVEAAREEAAAIAAGARAAFDAECARGLAQGREQARLEQAEQMIDQVGRTVDYYGRVEERLVALVMQAVQRIVHDFSDRERVLAVVQGALAVVRNQKQVTLRVAPSEVPTVKAALNELLAAYPGIGFLDIAADARLAAGACIVESDIGTVEASVQGQLEAMRKAFAHILGSRA